MPRTEQAGMMVWRIAGRLTDRDHDICHLLHEHRVLTTNQLTDVCFDSLRKAQKRLRLLHEWRVLDRFRPRHYDGGSDPFYYCLGPVGAQMVAADNDTPTADVRWRPNTAAALASSQRLAHLVGSNGLFTALIRAARERPECALREWWSEARCTAAWGRYVRPDGYGVWTDGRKVAPFLLEYDNGTERHARLVAKLDGYRRLQAAVGHPTLLLFRFPTVRRETEARRALADTGTDLPIVTGAPHHRCAPWDPAGPVWQPLRASGARHALTQLGSLLRRTATSDSL